ncbi:LexA family transcriptional regulator [Robbsia andropogonis]|uniref:LexA repressor n=1 Tax=Robbsia andropogonis TaxID=28092 RepID=A0A0F5JTQ0_9BURK|nr:transcriptional repressor LexA [Robbsia andropogonis]KKB61216.1 LexA family transcriptional regulator [Robbsia andropogonis]MCP1120955.1 transcriptional repressor LexA [Robbsia andropogonis]MCP1130764.1 transcriptional repressor LexA [Robbsia andropogonis]
MLKLTARQQQVFDLVVQAIERSGFPPTRAEIATALGFSSANAAEEHLRALARKGVIVLSPGASRGIRIVQNTDDSAAFTDERAATRPRPESAGVLPRDIDRASPRGGVALAGMLSQATALSLPLIGRVAAGSPILAQEHVLQQYQCDPTLFSNRPDYLLQVRGLSMRDIGILDGDLLAVQRQNDARDGQIVVARLGDEVTVKRLKRIPEGIALLAENPDYPTIVVDRERSDFALEGIAVGLIRPTPL